MKPICVAGLLWLAFCTTCFAQQTSPDVPATREDVERYFQVAHSRELWLKAMRALSLPIHKMFHDQFVKNQDKLPTDFEELLEKQLDDMDKNLPFDEIQQAMIPAYQKHLSKNDLDALTAFYSSPTGQKILNEMPEATAEATSDATPIMQRYMEEMRQRLQGEMDAMLREGDKALPKNPSPTH